MSKKMCKKDKPKHSEKDKFECKSCKQTADSKEKLCKPEKL